MLFFWELFIIRFQIDWTIKVFIDWRAIKIEWETFQKFETFRTLELWWTKVQK